MNNPRNLDISCEIGYLDVPEPFVESGIQVQHIVSKKDAYYVPDNYEMQSKESIYISPRLKPVGKAGNCLLPEVNKNIGAPGLTFLPAGIMPGEIHPLYNLVRGASYSDKHLFYDPDGKSESDLSEEIARDELYYFRNLPIYEQGISSTPYVKSKTTNLGSVFLTDVKTTYNIWGIDDISDEALLPSLYKKFIGSVDGIAMAIDTDNDGKGIAINATNAYVTLGRKFPISQDMIYSGVKLTYPSINDLTFPDQVINCRPNQHNTGFQLHFTTDSVGFDNKLPPQILIDFGDIELAKKMKAYGAYRIALCVGFKPRFYYHNFKEWKSVELEGEVFQGGSISVYVHFCGSLMFLGLSDSVEEWNVFYPIDSQEDYTTKFSFSLHKKSTIRVSFQNIHTVFTYAPIAFNNFNPEQLTNNLSLNDDKFEQMKSFIQFDYYQNNSYDYKDLLGEFENKSYLNAHDRNIVQVEEDKIDGRPTWYNDWRASTDEIGIDINQLDNNGVKTRFQGLIKYNTTIEGALFQYAQTYKIERQENKPVFKKLFDVTEYVQGNFSISETAEYNNYSYVTRNLSGLRLVNLLGNSQGRIIAHLLNTNRLAIKISAAYKGDNHQNSCFFMGILNNPNIEEGGYTLSGVDFLDTLLKDTLSNSRVNYTNVAYKNIIKDIVAQTGMGDYLYFENEPYLNFFLGQSLGADKTPQALIRPSLALDIFEPIQKPLRVILETAIPTSQSAIAVLYYEPNTNTIQVSNKNSFIEELFYVGDLSKTDNKLANTRKEREHGVLVGKPKFEISNDNLYSDILLTGQNNSGVPIAIRSSKLGFTRGTEAKRLLELAAKETDVTKIPDLGYIGYEKTRAVNNPYIYRDNATIKLQMEATIPFLTQAQNKVTCSCLVTRKLQTQGRFTLLSSDDSKSNPYYYQSVSYDFDINKNIITASIRGERIPIL